MQSLHSHLDKIHVGARMRKIEEGDSIDWGFAEALSIGTLLRHEQMHADIELEYVTP